MLLKYRIYVHITFVSASQLCILYFASDFELLDNWFDNEKQCGKRKELNDLIEHYYEKLYR